MQASTALPARMNTRIEDLTDVTDIDHPLVLESLRLIDALRSKRITVIAFQAAIAALHERLDLVVSLAPWIERALATQTDQVLYRRTVPTSRETIQLFFIAPHEVHPPHSHHNVVSTQVLLHGSLRVREYDVLARLAADRLLLRLRTDGRFVPGDAMRTTEVERNAHWFAAESAPAVMLNFNIYGYQDWTLNPPDAPFRRRLLDPTGGASSDGLIVAREIDIRAGYAMFAGKPIDAFPIPRHASPDA